MADPMKKNDTIEMQADKGSNAPNPDTEADPGKVSRGTNSSKRSRKLKARDSERKKRYRNDDAKNEVVRFERRVLKSAIPAILKWLKEQDYLPTKRKRSPKANSSVNLGPVQAAVQNRENNTDQPNDKSEAKPPAAAPVDTGSVPAAPPPSDTAESGRSDQRSEPRSSGPVFDAEGISLGETDGAANVNSSTREAARSAETSASLILDFGVETKESQRKRGPRVRTQPSGTNDHSDDNQTDLFGTTGVPYENKN